MTRKYFTRRFVLQGSLIYVSALHLSGCKVADTKLLEITSEGQYFSAKELTWLTDIAEFMIPRTETPGATDANVAAVLDGMMLSWASEKTRFQFQRALSAFETSSQTQYKKPYTSLLPEQRLEMLVNIDRTAFSKNLDDMSQDYKKLKELVFLIYYSSEEAGENYVPIPGEYHGNLTIEAYNALMDKAAYGR